MEHGYRGSRERSTHVFWSITMGTYSHVFFHNIAVLCKVVPLSPFHTSDVGAMQLSLQEGAFEQGFGE